MSQNYWDKVRRSRITRRRMLGGTLAVTAGVGAIAVVGCSKSSNSSNGGGSTPAPNSTQASGAVQSSPAT